MPENNIETGVDKLVELVNRKGKLSLEEAAKELGVGIPIVQEWADFLEDEGLISVEDRLRTTFLVERKLTKTEVEKKAKEYNSKKEAFTSKIDTALSSLQKEADGLDKIKEEFAKLKDAIGSDIDLVKEQLAELKHYEDLKKNMDKEILQQRLEYQEMLNQVRKKILEEKKKYEDFAASINSEKDKLEESRVEIGFLQKKQDTLQKRLEALQIVMKGISDEIAKHKKVLLETSASIDAKIVSSDKVRNDMKSRIELEMEPIMKKIKDNEERILAVQDALLKKIMARHKEMNTYQLKSTEAADKLKDFFERRSNIQDSLQALEKDKNEIEKSLKDLAIKAKGFNLISKNTDSKKFIHELEKDLNQIEKKKTGMSAALQKLTELIGKKN